MIVINPPTPPKCLPLVTTTPEHQAVETAIRIARLPFSSKETEDAASWKRTLAYHGSETTFVLGLPTPVSIAVLKRSDDHDDDLVDGATGVLELAASLAGLV